MAQAIKRHEGLAAHDLFAFPQFRDDFSQMGNVFYTQAENRVRLPSKRRRLSNLRPVYGIGKKRSDICAGGKVQLDVCLQRSLDPAVIEDSRVSDNYAGLLQTRDASSDSRSRQLDAASDLRDRTTGFFAQEIKDTPICRIDRVRGSHDTAW